MARPSHRGPAASFALLIVTAAGGRPARHRAAANRAALENLPTDAERYSVAPTESGSPRIGLRQLLSAAGDARAAAQCTVEHIAGHGPLLPSIYLARGGRLRCEAVQGYWQVFDGIRGSVGVIGRTWITGSRSWDPDVRTSPDFVQAVPVLSEVAEPLHVDGEVVGVLNVESGQVIAPDQLLMISQCAQLLSERLAEVGVPSESRPERLARVSARLVALAARDRETDLPAVIVSAACEAADTSSAALVVRERDGPEGLGMLAAAGPLAGNLLSLDADALDTMHSWAETGSSCYTVGRGPGVGHLGQQLLRAGFATLVVLPVDTGESEPAMLILADSDVVALPTDAVAGLELLAAQVGSCLQTRAALASLAEQAARDPRTGLPHAAAFRTALSHIRREEPVAIVYVDIDGFKQVNDTSGHAAGDRLLVAVARALEGSLRPGDGVFRLGGDEFAAMLRNANARQALEAAHRLHAAVRAEAGVTVSVGVAVSELGESDDALVHRADLALYTAKRAGRDCVRAAPSIPRDSPPAPR